MKFMKEELSDQATNADVATNSSLQDVSSVSNSHKTEKDRHASPEFDALIDNYPVVDLFFSFDIVNSTLYKSTTANWPAILIALLYEIRAKIKNTIHYICDLWRVIGDEMVFICQIYSADQLVEVVEGIFTVLQRITISLGDGSFFERIEGQSIDRFQVDHLKAQNILSVKATAWLAVERDKPVSPFDCVRFEYQGGYTQGFVEYFGTDIDAGFRLKEYTREGRLCVSFELAYFQQSKKERLHIIDYTILKGIWNNRLYPVIWYHSPGILYRYQRAAGQQLGGDFKESLQYDEAVTSPLIMRYLERKRGSTGTSTSNAERLLDPQMYDTDAAIRKLVADQKLTAKIQYLQSLLESAPPESRAKYIVPIELHCAAVCCDVQKRKVLITHRGLEHTANKEKWEFGCAHASGSEPLARTICNYYKDVFGVEIELVTSPDRKERQPLPIAVYELSKPLHKIVKGVIFVAKVISAIDESSFRAEKSHDQIRWISEEEIANYPEEMTVQDFSSTLHKVFDNFDSYFGIEK